MKFVLAALVLVCCIASVYSGAIVATPLKRAFDAALIEYITSGQRVDIQTTLPLGAPFADYQDCIPNDDEYPYPALQRRGSFTRLIRGIESLRIGHVGGPDQLSLAIASTLINIINNQYGGNLSPVWYFYNTVDEVFAALQYRQIDMTAPVYSFGTFFSNNTEARAYWFPHSCTVYSVSPQFVVLSSSSFTDHDELIGARVCTYSLPWMWLAQGAIPGTNIVVDPDCDSGLDNGIYDAIFNVQGTITANGPTRTIDAEMVVPYGAFFPNRGPPIDSPEPELPEPVELAFSVQPTPSTSQTPSVTGSTSLSSSTSLSQSAGTSSSPSTTSSPTISQSSSTTISLSPSGSISESSTGSLTPSISLSGVPTVSPSNSVTGSVTPTVSATSSVSQSNSASPTPTTSISATISNTNSAAPTSPTVSLAATNPLGNNG